MKTWFKKSKEAREARDKSNSVNPETSEQKPVTQEAAKTEIKKVQIKKTNSK